ncbi:MAG: hypothetical protein O2894_08040 [Planctomycetota bacterium]|nr:hypothetical protein [Planctomycetota bacterium]
MRLDARLGGFMAEDWGDGNGVIWGWVNGVRAPALLQMVGDTSAEWGGPNRGMMTWELEPLVERPDATRVRFKHALFGRVSAETAASLDAGWRLLIEGCLKPYAETGKRPAAADADMGSCSA